MRKNKIQDSIAMPSKNNDDSRVFGAEINEIDDEDDSNGESGSQFMKPPNHNRKDLDLQNPMKEMAKRKMKQG